MTGQPAKLSGSGARPQDRGFYQMLESFHPCNSSLQSFSRFGYLCKRTRVERCQLSAIVEGCDWQRSLETVSTVLRTVAQDRGMT